MKKIAIATLVYLTLPTAYADSVVDDFTQSSTQLSWQAIGQACLTARTLTPDNGSGTIPACGTVDLTGRTQSGGATGTLPDAVGKGALRFTNDSNNQTGAIINPTPFSAANGLQVIFTTYTYSPQTNPSSGTGADGIGFYLLDGTLPTQTATGALGGSLGYSCGNAKSPIADGIMGGYVGIGMDEYGNFARQGDNTATGIASQDYFQRFPNTISLRGAGSVSAAWLKSTYPSLYPNPTLAQVQTVCSTGKLSDNTPVLDYPLISYSTLPSNQPIASESYNSSGQPIGNTGNNRTNAIPITYKLKITPSKLLSLQYSYNGGTWTSVNGLSPAAPYNLASNGAIPNSFRFGFGASTGGAVNIHEITCFQASSLTSNTSASVNAVQGQQYRADTQVYSAAYSSDTWLGRFLAYPLLLSNTNVLTVGTQANWDANCALTGGTCPGSNTKIANYPGVISTARSIFTSDSTSGNGIPFVWSSLTSTQKTALGGNTSGQTTLNYLRGDRTNEVGTGSGSLRTRIGLLGDIIDSSPIFVGPPNGTYTNTWTDRLYSTATMPENATGAAPYSSYISNSATRLNVIYTGANDGMLHGFESGAYKSDGSYDAASNDGKEVFAYVPNAVFPNLASLANPNYSHNYYVDGVAGKGDLFYNNAWHTWVVSGLGSGGKAIFALDVTDPTLFSQATTTNAGLIVKGEWNTGTLTNLGNLYGQPLIRRMHNGQWAIIFGNGYNSSSGLGGIYILLINASGIVSNTPIFLSTGVGSAATPNGISYVTSSDMDYDNVTDYLYAGDLYGNLWRFDVTSINSSYWAVSQYGRSSATPLFVAGTAQPITTVPLVLSTGTAPNSRIIISFGTGNHTPISATSADTYATGKQNMYGIWDYDMANWNLLATNSYLSIPAPQTVSTANLQPQTITALSTTPKSFTLSTNAVNWCKAPTTLCTNYSSNQALGWTVDLSPIDGTMTNSQVIYNPVLGNGLILDNVATPASTTVASCNAGLPLGTTFGFDPATGGGSGISSFQNSSSNFSSALPSTFTPPIMAIQTGAVGSVSIVSVSSNASVGGGASGPTTPYVISNGGAYGGINKSGVPPVNPLNPSKGPGGPAGPGTYPGNRVIWRQLR